MRVLKILPGLALLGCLALPAPAEACAPLGDSLRELSAALDEVRLEEAATIAAEANAALGCQPEVVSNLALISLYQLSGAVQIFLGDTAAAEVEFGRAIAVSPTARLDAALGSDAEAVYERVRGRALAQQGGVIGVEPLVQAWVDGRKLEETRPFDLAAGQHLIQVERGGELQGSFFRIGPGETRVVTAEGQAVLSSTSSAATASTAATTGIGAVEEPVDDGPRWGLVIGGAVGLAAGAGVLVAANSTAAEFQETDQYDQLAALKLRNNALAVTGITLGVAGAGLVGVGFIDGAPALTSTLRW